MQGRANLLAGANIDKFYRVQLVDEWQGKLDMDEDARTDTVQMGDLEPHARLLLAVTQPRELVV